MKLKQVNISSAFVWSPIAEESTWIAAGSVAGAMAEDFSAEAQVEIYACDIHSNEPSMPLLGRVAVHDRLYRMDWSPHGRPRGIIAGALVEGSVVVWDAEAIANKKGEESRLCTIEAHSSSVRAIHFNPSQSFLLATSGQDRELRIWSLNDPTQALISLDPTTQKNPHTSEVTDLKWNPKFAHILACTTSGGQAHVWDLKTKRCTVTFQDPQHKGGLSCVAWHPDVATHVVVATDDAKPVIQLWDLRKAVAPIRTTPGHAGGILGVSWCSMDSNLLMSCGRDGRTICWNPNTGDLIEELPPQGNWVFDVQWSPLVPTLMATSSFDNALSVFAMQGGSGTGVSAPSGATAPKWLKRSCSASFGFGGKLFTFNDKTPTQVQVLDGSYNSDLVKKESELEKALTNVESLTAFAKETGDASTEESDRMIWNVIATLNTPAARSELSNILGFNIQKIKEEAEEFCKAPKKGKAVETLVKKCLLSGCVSDAAEVCFAAGNHSDALAIAAIGPQDLQNSIRARYIATRMATPYMRVLDALDRRDVKSFTQTEDLKDTPWKELLMFAMAYCDEQTVIDTCGTLGKRLEDSENGAGDKGDLGAQLCHMSSGNIDDVVRLWALQVDDAGAAVSTIEERLQKFMHKVSVYETKTKRRTNTATLIEKATKYAEILASLGHVESALRYLSRVEAYSPSAPTSSQVLYERLYRAARKTGAPTPTFPFQSFNVGGSQQQPDVFIPAHLLQKGGVKEPVPIPTPQPVPAPVPVPVQPPAPVHPTPAPVQPPVQPPVHPQPHIPGPGHHVQPQPVHPTPAPTHTAPAPVRHADPVPAVAAGDLHCLVVPTANVPPEETDIVNNLKAAVQAVADKRKRETIDKSLVALFTSLNERTIPTPVVALLVRFSRTLGTPEGKEIVKTLGTEHWDAFKPFMNIKFL